MTNIGEKIKNYRKRAEKSQMELELEIEAAPGSISRIENGVVNPTKETLIKIVDVLNLNAKEAAELFEIDITKNISDIVEFSKKISLSKDIDQILQHSVDDLVKAMGFLGAFIGLVENNTLYAKTFTNSWYTQLIVNIIGNPFNSYSLSLDDPMQENLMIRTVKDKKCYYSRSLSDHVHPPLSKRLCSIVQKVVGQKAGISIPLIAGDECIGLIYFSKNYDDNFEKDIPVLEQFAGYLGMVIINFI